MSALFGIYRTWCGLDSSFSGQAHLTGSCEQGSDSSCPLKYSTISPSEGICTVGMLSICLFVFLALQPIVVLFSQPGSGL